MGLTSPASSGGSSSGGGSSSPFYNYLVDLKSYVLSLFHAPDGAGVMRTTNLDGPPFMDDFGGSAVNTTTNWDDLPGGLAAAPVYLPSNPSAILNNGQAAIGTGTVGSISYAVSNSALVVTMGTTNGSERWLLSQRTVAAGENIIINIQKSQSIAANDVFVGLVEVDPTTLVPLANPNLANYFTNMAGANFGLETNAAYLVGQAIGDSSGLICQPAYTQMTTSQTTAAEYEIEVSSEDVIISQQLPDSATAKNATVVRVSTQCPNDGKVYKLLMRFRNVSAPGSSTTYTIQRVLLECKNPLRVVVDSGNGDQVGNKAIATNLVSSIPAGSATIGIMNPAITSNTSNGSLLQHKLFAAATTNATSVKTSAGKLAGGIVTNQNASTKYYFHIYNLATAPTVGTSVPILTIPILPNSAERFCDWVTPYGLYLSSGLSYAITAGYADTDASAVSNAGDVIVNLLYL